MVRATVGAAALTALLSAGAAAAPLGPDWPALEGRWVQTTRTLPALAVAIVRCGGGLCGRPVRPDGSCGPTIFRLDAAERGTAFGTLTVRGGGETAILVFRDGPDFILRTTPRRLAGAGGTVQPLSARFVRAGDERCR